VVAICINTLGYRVALGIAVGDSEAEGFWRQFQGCSWQRCRVHCLRNLLSHVPKAGQDMVTAAMQRQSAGGHKRCA
jgi:putative transposase